MVDVTETIKHTINIINYQGKIFEATVSTNDTITFSGFSTVTFFKSCKKSDGATEVEGSISSNVVTITTLNLTSVDIIGFVVGTPT